MKKLLLIMAHYNHPVGLEASLRSIHESFEVDVIVVDDGSDQLFDEEKLRQIYTNGRIFFEYLKENQGVGIASNKGLEFALNHNYTYTGRFDCGDICHAQKFAKQIAYLEEHQEVKLLGTWARVLDNRGNFLHYIEHPPDFETIKKRMYLNSMFLNPSVIYRTKIISEVGNYPLKYKRNAEDYAFFFNVLKRYRAENYPEVLMDYIIEPNSLSTSKRREQVGNRIRVTLDHFYFGWYPIYGLMRNSMLYLVPRSITTFFKALLFKATKNDNN